MSVLESAQALWQSRYKAKLVEDEAHHIQLVAYIHLNSVSAGLVGDPGEHVHSGHRELLGATAVALVDTEHTLELFGDSLTKARRSYVRFLEGVESQGWRTGTPGSLPWWNREVDRPVQPPPPSAWIDDRGLSTGRSRPLIDAAEFLESCAEELGVSLSLLVERSRRAEIMRVRYLIAGVGIERWRQRPGKLASCLGRWPEAVGRWAQRAGELRLKDDAFREAYETLDNTLSARLGSVE